MRFTVLCLSLLTLNASSKSSLGTTNTITALVAFPPAVAYFQLLLFLQACTLRVCNPSGSPATPIAISTQVCACAPLRDKLNGFW